MQPVKFQTLKNKYEYLKTDCLEDVEPVEATASWTLTDSRNETITITNALLPDGSWVYGYVVYWAKGGTSTKQPTAELGRFRSQREAKLHAIGFMLIYMDYFLPETQEAIRAAEARLVQGQLFD